MLVTSVAYQGGKKLAEIQVHEIRSYLSRPGCFVWVALRDATSEDLIAMQEEFDLHPLAVEDARQGHQRPKIEEYGDSLFLVLKMIEETPQARRVGEVDIFAGRNYVLSVRTGVERGFQDVRQRCEREPELLRHGPGYVLYALMDAVVDRYFPVIDGLQDELEDIEERIFADKSSAGANIEALYKLKRRLMTLKHAVSPLLETVSKLYGGRVPPMCVDMQHYFRDVFDHLVRLNGWVDTIREMVITAISVNLSMINLHESETMKRLAAYAALVAVPTMVAGIYGMNFKQIPELTWDFGYPTVLGVMFVLDLYLFWRFRKARWL